MIQEIKELIEGNKKFKEKFFEGNTLFDELLQHGQKPKIMIVSCSDSRVDPAVIFNCEPGELFVVRNVANLIPPCENTDTYHGTSAALEFGTCILEVEHIIILGHGQCGGILALIENSDNILNKKEHSFIVKWMEIARPGYDKVMAEHTEASIEEKVILCEKYALVNSLNNLRTFPWVQERINSNKLTVHAWFFNLENGEIFMYDQQKADWCVL